MEIYWYWPFPHRRDIELASTVVRPGDRLTVQCLEPAGTGAPAPGILSYELIRDLPVAGGGPRSRTGQALDRARVYVRRASRRARIVRRSFDVCHVHGLNHFTDWWALRRLASRCPIVATVHDAHPGQWRMPEWAERRLLRATYGVPGVTLVVAHEWIRDELVRSFGVDGARVRVIPLTLASGPLPDLPARGRRETVLFFGRYRSNKGMRVLFEAIRRSRGVVGWRFHFAGGGDPTLELEVAELAAEDDRVTYETGFIGEERKRRLLCEAGLVVMPYTVFPSQSGVLRDAYTCGTPVVVAEVGAMGSTVLTDRTGWLLRPGDPDDLLRALREAIESPEERRRVELRMAELRREMTHEVVGARLRRLYDEITAARG